MKPRDSVLLISEALLFLWPEESVGIRFGKCCAQGVCVYASEGLVSFVSIWEFSFFCWGRRFCCDHSMNTRYFFSPDTLCSSVSSVPISSSLPAAADERIGLNSWAPPSSRAAAPPFLIRLAMKASRSRWYSFLRRVFHYQNGSGSDLGPNPFDSKKWMLMEFISLTVQILVTPYVLSISKEEKPVWPMRIWVTGYAFGCFLSLILLLWRYRLVHLSRSNNTSDIEQQRGHDHEESRYELYHYFYCLK